MVAERTYRQNPWPIAAIVLGLGGAAVGYFALKDQIKKHSSIIPLLTIAGVGSIAIRPRVGKKMATTIDTLSTGLLGVAAFSVLFSSEAQAAEKEIKVGEGQKTQLPTEMAAEIGVDGNTEPVVDERGFVISTSYPAVGALQDTIKFKVKSNFPTSMQMRIRLMTAQGWNTSFAMWQELNTWEHLFKPGETKSFAKSWMPLTWFKKQEEKKYMFKILVLPPAEGAEPWIESEPYKYLADY